MIAAWAARYAGGRGKPIFLRPEGRFIGHGWKDATRDPDKVAALCQKYPRALIAMPTGSLSGHIVLDIDRKNGKDGFDTLERWGKSVLPETPMVHTPHGGLHLHFAVNPAVRIFTVINWPYGPGETKKQSGLDVLGEGGSIALPTPGYGYRWDEHLNLKTVPLVVAPAWLASKAKQKDREDWELIRAEKLLQEACARIRAAGPGARHAIVVREAFIIGCVVARGRISEATALHELQTAVAAMAWDKSYTARQASKDINQSIAAGIRKGGAR